jgi:hypothetical protein
VSGPTACAIGISAKQVSKSDSGMRNRELIFSAESVDSCFFPFFSLEG